MADRPLPTTRQRVLFAAAVGLIRQALQVGYQEGRPRSRHNHPAIGEEDYLRELFVHVQGAIAEEALAEFTNAHWEAVRTVAGATERPDLANGYEVRTSRDPRAVLRLRPGDHSDRWYALVIGVPPLLVWRGSIRGDEGMAPKWWNRDANEWHVPQSALYTPP